jgi:hypothetical protein
VKKRGILRSKNARIEGLIKKAWEKARRVFAFNLLDDTSKPPGGADRSLYYADKAHFPDYCKTLCPASRLVDGYLDNDFTIIMEKGK